MGPDITLKVVIQRQLMSSLAILCSVCAHLPVCGSRQEPIAFPVAISLASGLVLGANLLVE